MKKQIRLSKSKIKDILKCDLMGYRSIFTPREKSWDKSTQHRFDQGRVVESLARAQFPLGIEQNAKSNHEKLELTQRLLKEYKTVFEPAFVYDECIVQFDILTQNDDGSFDVIEVKSGSSFKEDYEIDTTIQYYVATKAGALIRKFEVWFVNKESSSIHDPNYFTKLDVTQKCVANKEKFNQYFEKAKSILELKKAPEAKVGAHCDKYECPFRNSESCRINRDAKHVLSMPRFTNAWKAFEQGITSVNDSRFDEFYNYGENNPVVMASVRQNKLVINQAELLADISKWKMPLNFFDFETLASAVPVLDGQRPYEQVVVQFSNHIYEGNSDELTHQEYLHQDLSNPNLSAIESMLSVLESNQGSVVSYNMSFEKSRILELAKKYPQYRKRLVLLTERFVDLMDIVKDYVYHPNFMGSYSLKVVSPTLLHMWGSYSDSMIKSGSEIAQYFEEMVKTSDLARKEEIAKSLKRYCCYDTLNLFLLFRYLTSENHSANLKNIVEANLKIQMDFIAICEA